MAKSDHLYYKPDAAGLAKIERLREKVIELDALIDELVLGADAPGELPYVPGESVRAVTVAQARLRECRQHALEAIVRRHDAAKAAAQETVQQALGAIDNG